jgi:hypothetical protein
MKWYNWLVIPGVFWLFTEDKFGEYDQFFYGLLGAAHGFQLAVIAGIIFS